VGKGTHVAVDAQDEGDGVNEVGLHFAALQRIRGHDLQALHEKDDAHGEEELDDRDEGGDGHCKGEEGTEGGREE